MTGNSAGADAPRTPEQYEREGRARWPRVVTALAAGSRIQIKGIMIAGGWPVGRFGIPLGLVLEGEWVNVGLVNFYSLGRAEGGETPSAWRDPRGTEPVETARPAN